MIRVAIIDDHAIVRMGLKYAIGRDGELDFVGELANGDGAIDFVREVKPDVLLLDVYMPGSNGVTVLGELMHEFPDLKVLMLTTSSSFLDVYHSLKKGARGYLMKDRDSDDLYNAIKIVAKGDKYIPQSVKELLAMKTGSVGTLTRRELDVLEMMAHGSDNESIAYELDMTMSGVKQHIRHIFAKLEVTDRISAVLKAVDLGIVSK
ncbi:MAG: response regulator transcription factor [Kiritimatiellae bacterium]|nr:response regulator transcription factor [Kiritimatiellia bacterium]